MNERASSCWPWSHDWGKWTDVIVARRSWPDIHNTERQMMQQRVCEACGMKKRRAIS